MPTSPTTKWLFLCCFCILMMVAIGGLTRLTESGLSITQWRPVSGILPPLSDNAWQEEFAKYRTSPEYLKKNLGMKLQEFKNIFWLEYIHRLMGRITGVVFLLPLLYFTLKGQINRALAIRLGGIFVLGALQGVVGWYMVKSGLKDNPHVSQYWLAFHLGMAMLIYGLVLWSALTSLTMEPLSSQKLVCLKKPLVFLGRLTYLGSRSPKKTGKSTSNKRVLYPLSIILICIIFIQSILGAFVAGTHAGLIYNEFPLMDGKFVPDGLFIMEKWYLNLFENTTTIQFNHRIFAYFTCLYIIFFWRFSRNFTLTSTTSCAIAWLPVIVIMQMSLGIFTLLGHVPVILASLHQIFAMVLFSVAIICSSGCRGQGIGYRV